MKLKEKPKWEHFRFQLIYKLLDIITITKKFCEESLKQGKRNSFSKVEALEKVDKLIEELEEVRTEIIKVKS
jgi:hypothetical protein|tara:strand:+ start:437 stop:652 length:216 start_codon:yes stop_codon:yes gene_type:complete